MNGQERQDLVLRRRYRLVTPVATGATWEVWEGFDEVLTRPVAVKLLRRDLAGDSATRDHVRHQAIAAARLAHRGVVATFDTGEDEDTVFVVMELIRGRSVRQVLDEDGPLDPAAAAAITVQAADALHHAHEAGVTHGDLKPTNVLLGDGQPSSAPLVKVGDFGTGAAAGRGPSIDASADLHALGALLYEMVTGRPPIAEATGSAPPKPRRLRPGIPRGVEEVIERAMAPDEARRYTSAAEVARAVRSLGLGGDDAVPAVVREHTPPRGVTPPFHRAERRWLVPALVIAGLSAAVIVAGLSIRTTDVGGRLLQRPQSPPAAAEETRISPAGVRSFDPLGRDRAENEDTVGAIADGNPETRWTTDTYGSRDLGGLKAGVGVVIELPSDVPVRRLRVSSPTSGWDGQVHVAAGAGTDLGAWGQPVVRQADAAGTADFDLGGARGRFILLWVTRLGADRRFEIAEVEVVG